MAVVAVSLILSPLAASSGSGAAVSERAPAVKLGVSGLAAARETRSETCRSARIGLAWYRARQRAWSQLHPHASWPRARKPRNCADARYLAKVARIRAHVSRVTYENWVAAHTLHDPEVRPGNQAWHRAVQEAQRAYPGTRGWLLSCSASEGGWGRWVPNSDGAPPGGWLQFYESTFWRMWATAKVDVTRRGYRVPRSAHSWYSPLGQALAGAWGLTNGRRHEWSSSGC